ncbi:unnamed protein product [Prorocentrum cordatum]|uniref:Uncharacterized protein n=1 Tax=Prorocentrum cordatum TaxID=2364126 RepID=A0ABN9XQT3_9DINO|nr:unnamed protein product [Polarella glacialis]
MSPAALRDNFILQTCLSLRSCVRRQTWDATAFSLCPTSWGWHAAELQGALAHSALLHIGMGGKEVSKRRWCIEVNGRPLQDWPERRCGRRRLSTEEWAARLMIVCEFAGDPGEAPTGRQGEVTSAGDLEAPLVNEIMAAAPWRVLIQEVADHSAHINIKELRAYGEAMERVARKFPKSRATYFMDPTVTIGAVAKGRSPSWYVNEELRALLPHTVGHGHYPRAHFAPTRLNVADDPTRGRQVRPCRDGPAWLGYEGNDFARAFDQWASLPRQSRTTSDWARFLFKLLLPEPRAAWPWSWGLFDGTLGFPGEGPRRQALVHRRGASPASYRPLQPLTISRRARYMQDFAQWLGDFLRLTFEHLSEAEPREVAQALAAYCQHMFDSERPLGIYVETINGWIDQHRHLKRQLQLAWDVAWAWKKLVPAYHHRPTPVPVLLAQVSVALLWGWHDVAALLLLGFVAMLRPGELTKLVKEDALLPEALLSTAPRLYARVREPKTRHKAARLQHVRVDDEIAVPLLEAWLARLAPQERLWTGSAAQFRAAHDAVTRFLGISTADGVGLTPASLKAGGATWHFEQWENLPMLQWQGRWQASRTMEIYVQEVAAASLLPELPPQVRERIGLFASIAEPLLDQCRQMLHCRP